MDKAVLLQKLCHVEIRRILVVMAIVVSVVVVAQFFALPFGNLFSDDASLYTMSSNTTQINLSRSNSSLVVHEITHDTNASGEEEDGKNREEEEGKNRDEVKGINSNNGFDYSLDNETNFKNELPFEKGDILDKHDSRLEIRNVSHKDDSSSQVRDSNTGKDEKMETISNLEEIQHRAKFENITLEFRSPVSFDASNNSSMGSVEQGIETQSKSKNYKPLQRVNRDYMGRTVMEPTSLSQMNLLLALGSTSSVRWPHLSARDRELLSTKLQIENAPILRNYTENYSSIYRNVSMFMRSYELMESMLKVYIYKEGEKPIFHTSKQNGIYASEGWFIKLMEGNKKFVVKDPKKAHLFYLPFSSKMLRTWLDEQNLRSWKELQNFLDNYVDTIAAKYPFWNRTRGSDHFLVACHDWAPRITRNRMKNSIRALCNSNVLSGFKIGKDTTLPVTYIRGGNLQDDLGGKPPSERNILAFFAGSMHGYLRPVLLKYWENKEPDMKIFGPMPRDTRGTASYKEHMKSSKYCICARGYEVHTPRVVEAIVHECVPVIIADNYVPPFFEVLNWESFAVFIREDDIANLRNILLSISEEKYLAMHQRVMTVRQHFVWHKKAAKYDLFHMILHSVWYNRVFQMRSK